MRSILFVSKYWHIVVFSLIFLCQISASEELYIEAKRVYTDEKKGITTAEGDVHIVKERDILDANQVKIYVDKNRKPIKFEAIGNVNFVLFTQDERELKGKSNTLIYLIEANEYQLIGKAQVKETGKPNFIKGDKIVLNNKNGYANVESNKEAPVRVIIDLNNIQKDSDKNGTNNQNAQNPKTNP